MAELDSLSAATGGGDERGGPAEEAAIDAIARMLAASVRDSTPTGGVARRDAHPAHDDDACDAAQKRHERHGGDGEALRGEQ